MALCAAVLTACAADDDPVPDRGILRQPSGLALSPDGSVLLVTNGNWDRRAASGTLTLVDRVGLDEAIAAPGDGRACRAADGFIECDPTAFIDPERTAVLGDGVGNIAVDRPAGPQGPARLLISVRSPASVVWLDLVGGGAGASVECGQDDEGRCDDAHRIEQTGGGGQALPGDPGRISVGDVVSRFAYVPHLLGGAISLIALDGEAGPELVDVQGDFYREDLFDADDLSGGFAVAQRTCDPENAPVASRECSRPILYATHRYFPGLRQFTVAPGLDRILQGQEVILSSVNVAPVQGRPFMADVAFESADATSMLAVATTPPGLFRVQTSVQDGAIVEETIASVPLCQDPNALAIHRPDDAEALALVACRGDAAVAVVGLSSFRVLRQIAVGQGPSDVLVDAEHGVAFVANTQDSTVSVIGIDARAPDFLSERARLGLGAGPRQ